MPGVGFAQGEGNRDTPILRGNSTTADFFVDGVRDDVQYFRDVYNVERVEALKGPNAMIFGRGGVGGVLNRVTRQADWGQSREASVQLGSWDNKRLTADLGRGVNEAVGRARHRALRELRLATANGVGLERYGVNPTVAVRLGPATTLRGSYEFFHDERVADRGISSFDGRPVDDRSRARSSAIRTRARRTRRCTCCRRGLEHRFSPRRHAAQSPQLRQLRQVLPERVPGRGERRRHDRRHLGLQQRDHAAEPVQPDRPDRRGADRPGRATRCSSGPSSDGRTPTTSATPGSSRASGRTSRRSTRRSSAPTISLPVEFRQNATDADNHGVATVAAAYAQDQIALTSHLEAVVGLRFDSFDADVTNHRTGDRLQQPRRSPLAAGRAGLQADGAGVALRQLHA